MSVKTIAIMQPTFLPWMGYFAMIDRVDEFWPIVYPVTVGGGVPFFPAGARLNLKLVETKRFDSGPVLLRYQRA